MPLRGRDDIERMNVGVVSRRLQRIFRSRWPDPNEAGDPGRRLRHDDALAAAVAQNLDPLRRSFLERPRVDQALGKKSGVGFAPCLDMHAGERRGIARLRLAIAHVTEAQIESDAA